MNERKYKIVASDLDGTLLNEEQTVSEENFRAITERKLKTFADFCLGTGHRRGFLSEDFARVLDRGGKSLYNVL